MRDLPRTPWVVYCRRRETIAIMDADGREIIHWAGFDSSKVVGFAARHDLANYIVACVNAAAQMEGGS